MNLPHEAVLRTIGAEADRLGLEAYCVGGAVRDALLGRPTTDLDFVALGEGAGIRLARAVAERLGGREAHVYPEFGTAAVRAPDPDTGEALVLEFIAARKESYRRSSRKPQVLAGSLEDDQRRRDFSVNALALALNEERFGNLLDPFGGLLDLEKRVLRTPRDPEKTFEEDPLRMLRAARFAAQLGFRVDDGAVRAMRQHAERIGIVSQERVTEELRKTVRASDPGAGLRLLHETGLLAHVLPELDALAGVETVGGYSHKDNFEHTLGVLANLIELQELWGEDPAWSEWLRWAALFHDIAKPETKRFVPGTGWTFHGHEDRGARSVPKLFRRLALPLDERMAYVQKLVALHHRPVALVDEDVTDSAVRRLLFEAGDDVDDLMTLVRADITSKNPKRVRRYLSAFDRVEQKFAEVEEKDRLRNFQPPVDGHEIMETLGLPPGPAVGELKRAIEEAILEGEIPIEHDAAFAYLMRIKDDVLDGAKG